MECKKGILTADGARRLGVPHLAGVQVDYEPRQNEGLRREFAREVYYQGKRLGGLMSLSTDGVISCDYAEQMRTLLAPLDEDGARELAAKELASHGHLDAPAWAINDWLETYGNLTPETNKK